MIESLRILCLCTLSKYYLTQWSINIKANCMIFHSEDVIFFASSMLCGKSVSPVSGNVIQATTPATRVGIPRTSIGRGGQNTAKLPTNGQMRAKILDTVEQVPMA